MIQICPQRSAPAVQRCPSARRQRGAVAIMTSFSLVLIVALLGMALDLSRAYNRKAELHGLARATALAAAKQLNGTAAGIDAALQAADATAATFRLSYNKSAVSWNASALRFSSTPPPSSSWIDAGSARATPNQVYYVRVDTSVLNGGTIDTVFMKAMPDKISQMTVSDIAMAGRSSIDVTPLAICAMAPEPAAPRARAGLDDELIEFGFRRGVSYDLMQLNGAGTTPLNFAMDPLTAPGTAPKPGKDHFRKEVMARFVCGGSVWLPGLTGGPVTLQSPFPLDKMYKQFNSRFNEYESNWCAPSGAPPDANIKAFKYNTALPWMPIKPAGQVAQPLSADNKLWTVADQPPAGTTPAAFGPLWIHGKAVPFSAYSADQPEPVKGYPSYPVSAWPLLYKAGLVASGYPGGLLGGSPYMATSGVHFEAPSKPNKEYATRYRRILNIPLLECPVTSASSGTVIGVGRFLMTVPATATSISTEFIGAIPASALGGNVELL